VFGVAIFGASSVTDAQFQHIASVTAEWLDNDQDGCVDNSLVLTKMLPSTDKACMLAPGTDGSFNEAAQLALESAGYATNAVTYNNEILPNCAGAAATSQCADASLEEVNMSNAVDDWTKANNLLDLACHYIYGLC